MKSFWIPITMAVRWLAVVGTLIAAPMYSSMAQYRCGEAGKVTIDRNEMNLRLIRLSEARYDDLWGADFDLLTEPRRVFRGIWELELEVSNGGLYQYFWNSSAHSVPAVQDALRTIGAPAMAQIVKRAIATVDGLPWRHDDTRRKKLEELSDSIQPQLDRIETEFFRYPDDLTTLLYCYVSKYRDAIGAPENF